MNTNGCHRRGFTLVEVLATLVLLGIILPIAMRGVSMAMAAASNARRTAEATSLAEAKLNMLLVDSVSIEGVADPMAPYSVTYRVSIPNYAAPAGDRLLLQPAVFTRGRPARSRAISRRINRNTSGPASRRRAITG